MWHPNPLDGTHIGLPCSCTKIYGQLSADTGREGGRVTQREGETERERERERGHIHKVLGIRITSADIYVASTYARSMGMGSASP
jgi:hypothetical protein